MVLGAGCSWQQGECNIQKFLDDYDWAFYRNAKDHTFRDAILDLNKTTALLKSVGAGPASNDMFWMNPFSEQGARFAGRVLPVMHDFRVSAENALILLYRDKNKARLHQDSLQYMTVAAMRLDYLGMKVEMADEINRYYREMYAVAENPAATPQERGRVNRNMSEITATNGRLQDLRDGITRLRKFYSDLWLSESRPYWLPNVQVRYDRLALLFTDKIEEVKAARSNGKMTPPEQLGFFDPIAPALGSSMRRGGPPAPAPGAQPTGGVQPTAPAPAQPGNVQQIPPTQPAPAAPPSQKPPVE
jgi:hypothetical protein